MYTLIRPAGSSAQRIEPSRRGVKICERGRPAGAAKRWRVGTQSAVPMKVWGRVNFQRTRRVCRRRVRREEEEEGGAVPVVLAAMAVEEEDEEEVEEEEEAAACLARREAGPLPG